MKYLSFVFVSLALFITLAAPALAQVVVAPATEVTMAVVATATDLPAAVTPVDGESSAAFQMLERGMWLVIGGLVVLAFIWMRNQLKGKKPTVTP